MLKDCRHVTRSVINIQNFPIRTRDFANCCSFWGVFWIDVSSPSIAKSNFIALASLLGSSVEDIDEARQLLANVKKNWLLILDNADDPDFDYQVYFPSGVWGTIIMTSRVSDCREYSTVGTEILTGLDEEDSVELLFKVAEIPLDSRSFQEEAAREIVKILGSHTLALIQAGAYIARGHCLMKEFPKVFQKHRDRLLKSRPKQAQSRYFDVFTTFEASASVLEFSKTLEAKDALCLLDVLSMLHFSDLPMRMFEEAWKGSQRARKINHNECYAIDTLTSWHVSQLPGFMISEAEEWDSFRLQEAINLLASLFLINKSKQHEISMHPLMHAWAKDRLTSEKQGQVWNITGSILALSIGSSESWQTHGRQRQPHIHSYIDLYTSRKLLSKSFPKSVPMIPQMLVRCGSLLSKMRDNKWLADLLKNIFDDFYAEFRCPSKSKIELLPLFRLQAINLRDRGEAKHAVRLLEQIVEICEDTVCEHHSDRLTSQHVLACAYAENNQIEEAIELFKHVVKIRETTLSEDDLDRLSSQHELARTYLNNNQIKQAIRLLEHVVKIEGMRLSENNSDRLNSQHVLARAYLKNGQIEQAIELFEHVFKILDVTLPENSSDRLASQHELARAYLKNNQIEQAIELFERVVKIREIVLSENDSRRLTSQHELARAYLENNRIEQAIGLFEHVVKIQDISLFENNSNRLTSQHELARAYLKNDQIEQAVELFEHVVKIQDISLSEDDSDRLSSQHGLACAYLKNNKIKEAAQLLEHVVNIEKVSLAENRFARLMSLDTLASAYEADGQFNQAKELFKQIRKIDENYLDNDDSEE